MINTYHIRIPEKITVLFPEWEAHPPFKNFHIERCKLILSTIATHIQKSDHGIYYSQLKLAYLNNRVYNAKLYLKFLKEAEIIKTYGGFVRNDHSYRYQFTDKYSSHCIKIELTDQKLINNLTEIKAKEGRKRSRKYPVQRATIEKLTIDVAHAEKIAGEMYSGTDEFNNAIGAIDRIAQQDWTYRQDETVFRLHTNLTNFPMVLRGELMIDGKKLSGVDIRNSVPYMANKIFTDPESVRRFYPEPDKYPSTMLKCLRLPEQQDVKRYTLLTSKAQFYKCLETEFNKRGCNYAVVSDDSISEELKRKIFQILFSDNKFSCKEKRIFMELFPGVNKAFSVLRMYKRDYFNYTLGRLESHVILDVILDYLNSNYPDTIATQVYDNVTTSIATDDIDTVSRVMVEKLTDFVGVPPTLKTENFSTARIFSPSFSLKTKNNTLREERGGRRAGYPHTVSKSL
jgi:hypothetical protein